MERRLQNKLWEIGVS